MFSSQFKSGWSGLSKMLSNCNNFFCSVQKDDVLFSKSQKHRKLLKNLIGGSFHEQSETRWTARFSAVKPFAAHTAGIKAIENLTRKNFPSLTAASMADIIGFKKYLFSFTCIPMPYIWFEVLKSIDNRYIRNQTIQKQDCTLNVAVKNVCALLSDSKDLRETFDDILFETLVAEMSQIDLQFPMLKRIPRVKRILRFKRRSVQQIASDTMCFI